MKETSRQKAKMPHDANTREKIRAKALEQGEARADVVETAVRTAMRTIEAEIRDNEGIYPANKGALSANEVARRAGIHNTTLYGTRYKSLLQDIKSWKKKLETTAVTGRMRVKRELATRIADWRQLYDGLSESHRITELDLQETERKLEDANAELARLREKYDLLLKSNNISSNRKVVSIRNHLG
ncbi:hypothetical protein [Comamonas sp. MYb69]|uniref:hypothetical protein n=1 Tax=Comamonas sp. MYb69 TaxID=1848650 RepID=UPI0030ACC8B9